MIEIIVEEFETGAWVADVKSQEPLTRSFELAGETWTGSIVSERNENNVFIGRIVGGAGGLSKQIPDVYYRGNTLYSTVISAICAPVDEIPGTIVSGTTATYHRMEGSAGAALERFAQTYGLQWFVGRDGRINVGSRPSGPVARGERVDSGPNGYVVVGLPENVQINGTFEGITIKHIRWYWNANRFEATIYSEALPSLVQPQLDYGRIYSARVDSQNTDGTINVIVAGRFSLSNIQVLSGIPSSRVDFVGGDLVTIGFFGADARAPFAIGTWQVEGDHSSGDPVARKGDSVACGTLTGVAPPEGGPVTFSYQGPAGGEPVVSTTITIEGRITSGNDRVRL